MHQDPTSLIDRSIAVLESLAASFASEVAAAPAEERLDEARRRRKEVLLTLSILIPKLRAARTPSTPGAPPGRGCAHCPDD